MTETYTMKFVCGNCGAPYWAGVPKGTTTSTYAATHPCLTCGCCRLAAQPPERRRGL